MLSSVLDVAIALLFVFVLFSLVVSALNEIWLSYFDKRDAFVAAIGDLPIKRSD